MNTYEIKTYSERDKFKRENTNIGYHSGGVSDFGLDIWICELYQNIETNKYSLLIVTDTDESWIVLEFD